MFGNGFPVGYQPATPQLNPYQYQQYQNQQYQGYQPQQSAQAQQTLTPPTIHAEIIQIDGGRKEVESKPVNVGCSQMFMAKDEQAIYIKSQYANGQFSVCEYRRQDPEQEKPEDPLKDYVTIDMLNSRLKELLISLRDQQRQQKRQENKEGREEK